MNEPARTIRQSKPKRIVLKTGVIMILLAGLLTYFSQCGVRVVPPTGSPYERFDQEAAGIFPNAALIYEEAITVSGAIEAGMRDWPNGLGRDGEPICPAIAAWIDDQEALVHLLREAADCERCYFPMTAIDGGFLVHYLAPLRSFSNLLGMRARLAAERRDLPRFRESLLLLDRIAEHLQQQPPIIAFLVGDAVRATGLEIAARPLIWSELTGSERVAYMADIRAMCAEKALTAEIWQREVEMNCYSVHQSMDWKMQLVVPRSRVWGELLRLCEPVHQLLSQSIERQIDPANPLAAQLAAGIPPRTIPRALANPARVIAERSYVSPTVFLDAHAKIITIQRGTRLLLSIFEHAEKAGQLPPSLDALAIPGVIEPFTKSPFVYRPTAAGFQLYAAWVDRDDDGGRPIENRRNPKVQWMGGAAIPDGDRVFWPITEDCLDSRD